MIQVKKKKNDRVITLTYKSNFLEVTRKKEGGRERERYKKSGSRSMNFISNVTIQNEKLPSKVIRNSFSRSSIIDLFATNHVYRYTLKENYIKKMDEWKTKRSGMTNDEWDDFGRKRKSETWE